MKSSRAVLVCFVGFTAGCAAEAPPPASSASQAAASSASRSTNDDPRAPADPSASESGAPSTSSSAPPSGAAPRPPRHAADTLPEGLEPLTEAEKKELSSACKPLSSAVAAAARKSAGRSEGKSSTEVALAVLASPPSAPGADVPRCAGLMIRDLSVYRARAMESEASMSLKRLSFAIAGAHQEGQLCASAPPVPADVSVLRAGAYTSTGPDWQPPGWRCARFEQLIPQRYQYELRTDAAAKSYEAIARGFPVEGGPVSELFVRGRVEDGQLQPTSEIYRR